MNQEVFQLLSDLIYRESGIVIPPEKALLLGNRVQKRLRALGLPSASEYVRALEADASGEELVNLIDVVSTNVTYFYREPRHFEVYRQLLGRYRAEGRREVKVWCAAASSGEEPYTLAIEGHEALAGSATKLKILGTDICTAVLRRAVRADYREKAVEKMPPDRLAKYLEEYNDGEPCWRVRPEIRSEVLFKRLNLVEFPYPLKGPLDIIFCRNVMIYFDVPTRAKIIAEFSKLLRSGGCLFLSHSENLLGIEHSFKRFDSSVFEKA